MSAAQPPIARAPRWYWEDFPAGSVREFGPMTVTREAVIEYARL
jgi:acyl dehydratase